MNFLKLLGAPRMIKAIISILGVFAAYGKGRSDQRNKRRRKDAEAAIATHKRAGKARKKFTREEAGEELEKKGKLRK